MWWNLRSYRVLISCLLTFWTCSPKALPASISSGRIADVPRLFFDFDLSVPTRFEKQISAAMITWARHLGTSAERCLFCKGKEVIRFRFVSEGHGDRFPFEPGTSKVAHVVSSKSDRCAPEVHFYAVPFSADDKNVPDVYLVALHEVGHVLGLSHSADRESIMYPSYRTGGQILEEELISQFLTTRFISFPSEEHLLSLPSKEGNSPGKRKEVP